MSEVTLEFLARQNERILSEIGIMRDELRVQNAIIMRANGTLLSLLRESRNDRIRRLEDAEITS